MLEVWKSKTRVPSQCRSGEDTHSTFQKALYLLSPHMAGRETAIPVLSFYKALIPLRGPHPHLIKTQLSPRDPISKYYPVALGVRCQLINCCWEETFQLMATFLKYLILTNLYFFRSGSVLNFMTPHQCVFICFLQ